MLQVAFGSQPAVATEVGPIGLPLKIAAVSLTVPVRISFDIRAVAGAMELTGFAKGDLSELQAHALAIARGLPLPRDRCRHKGLNIVVESIDAASIDPSGTVAIVKLSGKVGVWACQRLLGAKVNTRLAADRVTLTVPVVVVVRNAKELDLRLGGSPRIETGRPDIRAAVQELVGDIDTVLELALEKLLDASAARAKLPQPAGIDLRISKAQFEQRGQTVLLRADGSATVTPAALTPLLTQLKK